MKYNIIGDIHSRKNWRELVDPSWINIFVGDYFSPYFPCPFDKQEEEFLKITEFARAYPDNVILLIGNHDEDHWHIQEHYSRFDEENVGEIVQLFEESKDLFNAAYSIENKILVTHAGVTKPWFNKYCENSNINPDDIAKSINHLWLSGKYRAFDFYHNSNRWDFYGVSEQHGPLWIRSESLCSNNVFKGTNFIQVVGHTQFPNIIPFPRDGVIFVDVLGYTSESLLYDSESDKFSVNKGIFE